MKWCSKNLVSLCRPCDCAPGVARTSTARAQSSGKQRENYRRKKNERKTPVPVREKIKETKSPVLLLFGHSLPFRPRSPSGAERSLPETISIFLEEKIHRYEL
jgi:hypothetical protein